MEQTRMYCCMVMVLVLLAILGVEADFEYQCGASDYGSAQLRSQVRACGRLLPEFIIQNCNPHPSIAASYVNRPAAHVEEKDVFLSQESASSMLRVPQSSGGSPQYSSGMVCECCVHRCTVRELRQYCTEAKPVRRRRSAASRRANPQSERSDMSKESVDKFYNLLEELRPYAETFSDVLLKSDVTIKIQQLDEQKRQSFHSVQGGRSSLLSKSERRKLKQQRRRNRHHKHRNQKRG